jgi:hypothetical protein
MAARLQAMHVPPSVLPSTAALHQETVFGKGIGNTPVETAIGTIVQISFLYTKRAIRIPFSHSGAPLTQSIHGPAVQEGRLCGCTGSERILDDSQAILMILTK